LKRNFKSKKDTKIISEFLKKREKRIICSRNYGEAQNIKDISKENKDNKEWEDKSMAFGVEPLQNRQTFKMEKANEKTQNYRTQRY